MLEILGMRFNKECLIIKKFTLSLQKASVTGLINPWCLYIVNIVRRQQQQQRNIELIKTLKQEYVISKWILFGFPKYETFNNDF